MSPDAIIKLIFGDIFRTLPSCLITHTDDMVYSREHKAYELRTPVDDIIELQMQ